MLLGDRHIGFARVVTDRTVFSRLSDLVVCTEFRGRGLGEWLIDCIIQHPHVADTQVVLEYLAVNARRAHPTRDRKTGGLQLSFEPVLGNA